MMMEVAPGWTVDIERGPDWLFVRLHGTDPRWGSVDGLAEAVWCQMQQQFTNRVVVELDDVALLPSALIGELVRLYKRIQSHSGLMRLSGLNRSNREVLRMTRLDRCFPNYATRTSAVMGIRDDGET